MKSIKNKLLAGILLINSILLIGIFIFKFGFEDFYIKHTSKLLNEFGNEIKVLASESNEEQLNDYINKYGESKNISIDIYDQYDSLTFTNKYSSMHGHRGPNSQNKSIVSKKNRCLITHEYKIGKNLSSYIMKDKSQGIEFLATIVTSDDGLYSIICKTPISAIKNSVDIASNFLLMIFIPIIILSIFMAIYFSNKFTKPIIKLTKISNNMSNLDFSEKAEIQTGDEIEELGNSINYLSYKIKTTMTDLKFKNEELEIMIENKIKQEKLKREFVSSVSHELKTPITVIGGYAQGLKSNILDNEEDRNFYIDVICEESEKMGLMVNDLLDLYKLESKTFNLKKEKLNINELIKKVVKKQEFVLKEKEIEIMVDIDEELKNAPYAIGDKIRIEQVLNNLIDNAINYVTNENKIKVYTELIDEDVFIYIYNSGNKIKEEDLQKIWYSFVRLDKARTYNSNRIGLGLAIVKEIMELHDGECGAKNTDDGVVFWIKLKKFNL